MPAPITRPKFYYQKLIDAWEQKRAALRDRLSGPTGSYFKHPQYRPQADAIRRKLMVYRAAIRRAEQREQQVKHLALHVAEFMQCPPIYGTSRWDQTPRQILNPRIIMARRLFYTWGIDHGLRGSDLSKYTGAKYAGRASRCRLEFKRSFKHNREHLDTWQRFKDYMKEYGAEVPPTDVKQGRQKGRVGRPRKERVVWGRAA